MQTYQTERREIMDSAIRNFIEATAWEMIKPKPYGIFHLSFMIIGFALCALLAYRLKNIGEKGNRYLLMGIGIFLAVCELYKQLFYYYHICCGEYAWWIFPFQLCSVPMYLCIVAPMLKEGPIQKGMYSFMMTYNLLGGFITFFEPSGIITEHWTITLHAFTWHMLLVFIGLYLGFSRRGGYEIRDYLGATKTFLILCLIAFTINVAVKAATGESINMFFIGPQNSSLVVFKQISEAFGWYVSTALYIPCVCLGAYLIFLPFHLLGSRTHRTVLKLKNA